MTSKHESGSNNQSEDPFELLGIRPGANFEEIQEAKAKRLLEVGDDLIKKAKIEASYDKLLMSSLKERQKGNISNEAISASKKEEANSSVNSTNNVGTKLLKRIQDVGTRNSSKSFELTMPEGNGLIVRISLGILCILLVLVSSSQSIQLILSLSTIGLVFSQVRRGKNFLRSISWSLLLLILGLIIGQLLFGQSMPLNELDFSISKQQLESFPAILLIWLGILFL